MGHYPIVMDLAGRAIVVIGGGRVAERRVEALLGAGAAVTVVSPALSPALRALATEGRIRHRARVYRTGDLAGAALAFVAVGDPEVGDAVGREAGQRRILLNVADDPARCDFVLPSVLRRGDLLVAVSTGGASPALARAVREELETRFPEDWAAWTALVAEVRREVRRRGRGRCAETWRRALRGEVRRLVADGRLEDARRRLLEEVEAGP